MFVQPWHTAPFLRLLIPLIAGIITGRWFPVIPWPLMIAALCCWLLPLLLSIRGRFIFRKISGSAVLVMVYCTGLLLTRQADVRHQQNWAGHHAKDTNYFTVTLTTPPVKKNKSWKAEAVITAMYTSRWIPVEGKILLYFKESPAAAYGSRLLIHAALQPIKSSGNPGAFDYARYCSYSNIFHQVWLQTASIKLLPGNGGSWLGRWLQKARAYCLLALQRHIPGRAAYGIAEALLIGYREDLEKDIVQAYTDTGVVHIIAISGLHLGLIYVTLLQLLKWLPRRRWADVFRAMILITVLWGFSLLTGASASVLRSAVMFTTIAAGQFIISRHSGIFNTLAAAAFLLLCYHPHYIADAGFQLSFLAVGGIVLCYQPLYDLWMIRNKWVDKLWQMVAVSLAAQVFTWPVCLYYFNQFPNYFLPANIIAVPLSTMLLYGEIILMAVAEWPLAAHPLGLALAWATDLMNQLIVCIGSLPCAVLRDISLTAAELMALYAVSASLVACWLLRFRRRLQLLLWAFAALSASFSAAAVSDTQRHCLVIYNLPRQTVVEYVRAGNSIRWGDSSGVQLPALAAARMQLGIKTVSLRRDSGLIMAGNKRILLLDHALPVQAPLKKIKLDYIILSHNPQVEISRLQEFFIYEQLIFDASNAPFLIRKWKNACNKLPLRCFSVPDEGALVINL